MKKNLSVAELINLLLVVAAIVTAIVLYPGMPDQMPTHWNTEGQVNGYMPKLAGLFLLPGIMVVLFLLFYAVPRIDPLRGNIAQFRPAYDRFIIILNLFLLAVYAATLLWSRGVELSMNTLIIIGLAVLIFAIGSLCGKAKRNYFVGIRTPWTLQSETVWEKTHKLAATLFHIAGVVVVLGVFVPREVLPQIILLLILVPVTGVTLILVLYSYVMYEREQRAISQNHR